MVKDVTGPFELAEDPPPAHEDPSYLPGAGAPAVALPPMAGAPASGTAPAAPTPDSEFGHGSGVDLVPVARQMDAVKDAARSGGLLMDEETAIKLLASLGEIRDRVDALVADATELDVPLRLGDNWVARAMSERLHAVAEGTDSAAIRVLKQFRLVVEDYELAVRAAANRVKAADDDALSDLRDAARGLDRG